MHVAQGTVDASLGSHGVRPSGEKLGDASSLEAGFTEAKRSSEACSTSANDDGVVLMVDHGIVSDQFRALKSLRYYNVLTVDPS